MAALKSKKSQPQPQPVQPSKPGREGDVEREESSRNSGKRKVSNEEMDVSLVSFLSSLVCCSPLFSVLYTMFCVLLFVQITVFPV